MKALIQKLEDGTLKLWDIAPDFIKDDSGGYSAVGGGHHNAALGLGLLDLEESPTPEEFRKTFWQWKLDGNRVIRR